MSVHAHPNHLTCSVVLYEAKRLADVMIEAPDPVDLEVDRDGVLVCKILPANGRISGGIKLEGSLMQQSLDDFSERHLVPWLGRMGRLKALQEDLKALGVEV